MTENIEQALILLQNKINAGLDRIHDQALAKFRTLARSTGQRTKQSTKFVSNQ